MSARLLANSPSHSFFPSRRCCQPCVGVSRVLVLVLPWVPCGAGLGGLLLGRTGQFFLDTIPKCRAACSCARVGSQAAVGAPAGRDFPPCRTATGGTGQRADFQTAHRYKPPMLLMSLCRLCQSKGSLLGVRPNLVN